MESKVYSSKANDGRHLRISSKSHILEVLVKNIDMNIEKTKN